SESLTSCSLTSLLHFFYFTSVNKKGILVLNPNQYVQSMPYKLNRIVGGQNAELGEWPWQVSLHFQTQGHVCGASIISEKWLLSASHCFRYSYDGLQSQFSFDAAQSRKVKRIITHPSYNDITYDYDIALMELEEPLEFTKTVQPICLPAATHVFPMGMSCWVTGWGVLREQGQLAKTLQKASVKMINETVCREYLTNPLTSRMLCSGILSGGVDACQGDSGGPLSCFEESGAKWFQAGIVSWGEGCARRNKPGVYTRVSALRDWIKQYVDHGVDHEWLQALLLVANSLRISAQFYTGIFFFFEAFMNKVPATSSP
uniref:ST14 transmembrane serine protease matriptase n=1 Tax=Oryzias melastigma TaxID=30732 RepID=A0A3B3DUN7_ORYME